MMDKDRPSLTERLSDIRLIVFDLDGVVYTGDEAVAGAAEAIQHLKDIGYAVRYATNASGKTRADISGKLKRLGVYADSSDIYTSADATCLLVEKFVKEGKRRVFVCGAPSLVSGLRDIGADVVHDDSADIVIVGFDKDFTYHKLTMASRALQAGAAFVVANVDANYPVEGGVHHPGCGALVAALQIASGREPDYVAGKPKTLLLEMICKDLGMSCRHVAMVGDSMASDIMMAKQFEALSVLYTQKSLDCSGVDHPDYCIHSLPQLLSIFNGVELQDDT